MATKILTYETQLDLLKAFTEGDLKGYMPTEKIDTNKLSYPIKIEAQEGNYTFWLYKEPEVVETLTETKTETKKGLTKKQKIIIGCSVAGGIILIAIIATLLAIYLPSDSEATEAETELVIE